MATQTRSRKIYHRCRRHELSAFPTRFARKPFQFNCYYSYRDTVNAIWNCLVFPKNHQQQTDPLEVIEPHAIIVASYLIIREEPFQGLQRARL